MSENGDGRGTFDPDRLKQRVRAKAQQAISVHLEPGEKIVAMVPGVSAGPETRKRSLLPRSRHRLAVATDSNVYVFSYRFGRVRELELKQELGGLPVRSHDTERGGGYLTIGDLSLSVGASVWRDWRDEARRLVELNYGSASAR